MTRKEKKRRLQELRRMSKEELMQAYYLQQEKRAYANSPQIERNAFEIGKGVPQRRRVRAHVEKYAGLVVVGVRTGKNSVCVCKSRNLY